MLSVQRCGSVDMVTLSIASLAHEPLTAPSKLCRSASAESSPSGAFVDAVEDVEEDAAGLDGDRPLDIDREENAQCSPSSSISPMAASHSATNVSVQTSSTGSPVQQQHDYHLGPVQPPATARLSSRHYSLPVRQLLPSFGDQHAHTLHGYSDKVWRRDSPYMSPYMSKKKQQQKKLATMVDLPPSVMAQVQTAPIFQVPSHHHSDQRWRGGKGQPRRHYTISLLPVPRKRVVIQRATTWSKCEVATLSTTKQHPHPLTSSMEDKKSSMSEAMVKVGKPAKQLNVWPEPTLPKLPAQTLHQPHGPDLAAPIARRPHRNTIALWDAHFAQTTPTGSFAVDSLSMHRTMSPSNASQPSDGVFASVSGDTVDDNSSSDGDGSVLPVPAIAATPQSVCSHPPPLGYEDHDALHAVPTCSRPACHNCADPHLSCVNSPTKLLPSNVAATRARIHRDLLQSTRLTGIAGSCTSSRSDMTGIYSLPVSVPDSQFSALPPGPATYVARITPWRRLSRHYGIILFCAGFVCPPIWLLGAIYVPWARTERNHNDYIWRHRCRVACFLTGGAILLALVAFSFVMF